MKSLYLPPPNLVVVVWWPFIKCWRKVQQPHNGFSPSARLPSFPVPSLASFFVVFGQQPLHHVKAVGPSVSHWNWGRPAKSCCCWSSKQWRNEQNEWGKSSGERKEGKAANSSNKGWVWDGRLHRTKFYDGDEETRAMQSSYLYSNRCSAGKNQQIQS